MEYRLVFGSMLATVEDEVNDACKDGWKPHGSLVNTQSKYIQPMTREGYYFTQVAEDRKVERELMG